MNRVSMLSAVSIGLPIMLAFLAITIGRLGWRSPALKSETILFVGALMLIPLILFAAFSGSVLIVKAALITTGGFALIGAVFGLRVSRFAK